jgi:hypothetical protein
MIISDALGMPIEVEDALEHYGMPRRSGRYPWGSGKNPYQHSNDFISRYEELSAAGMKPTDIAEALGCFNYKNKPSTSVLRARLSIAKGERYRYQYDTVRSMREDGKTWQEISDRLGLSGESQARSIYNSDPEKRLRAFKSADTIRELVDSKGIIDVGAGVEHELGISDTKLKQSLEILQEEGYEVYTIGLPQVTNPGQQTPLRVICPPGTLYKDAYAARDAGNISSLKDYTVVEEGNLKVNRPKPPAFMSSDRVHIRYDEDGGTQKDGLIEIRPGVADLDLGKNIYAQVRIGVDDKYYMKGMCVYGDPKDFPDGCDVIFNSNKHRGTPIDQVLKPVKTEDPNNPFGAIIKEYGQSEYIGADGKKHLSPINKIRETGDWDKWEDGLPHQFLEKQNPALIERQLDMTYRDKVEEYNRICELDNPVIRRHYLKEYGDQLDSDAVYLKAASIPGQEWKVIIPSPSLKDNEVYAPTFNNGDEVVLVRFPHQGLHEIPVCRVNNKNPDMQRALGQAPDAIGINKNVADRLSGADFDGDTVLIIPAGKSPTTRIVSKPQLPGLEGFDPKEAYGTERRATGKKDEDGNDIYEYIGKNGKPIHVMSNTDTQMGLASNLITDMTIKGCSDEELARATRHAQVVIDAEKHKLDYRASYIDNGIRELKRKYQGRVENGVYTESASTLLSRAKGKIDVPETRGNPVPNPETGAYDWKETGRVYTDKKGHERLATKKAHQMDTVSDAYELSSGTDKENMYAAYANRLKALANRSRLEYLATERPKVDREASQEYAAEIASLKNALAKAERNSPRERQANLLAGARVRAITDANPDMSKKEISKLRNRELMRARVEVGSNARDVRIKMTDREWEAVQHNAISSTMLERILAHSDPDDLRKRATPRERVTLSEAKLSKMRNMYRSNYTIAEIAKALGVSTSTISRALNEESEV